MKGVLCQMLNITTFFSQLALLLLIPLLFSLFATVDDISMSLFVSCIFSILGSLLAVFLHNE